MTKLPRPVFQLLQWLFRLLRFIYIGHEKEINMSVAYKYHHLLSSSPTSNNSAQQVIRLLTIHPANLVTSPVTCSLNACHLVAAEPFEALSYTWGAKLPVYPIYINGQVLEVQGNLFAALRSLRYPSKTRLIWIDAICIDQSDIQERNYTVRFMRDIYASAKLGVVVWFGEAGHDTHLVEPFLEHLNLGYERKDAADKALSARLLRRKPGRYDVPRLDDPGYRALYNFLITPWSSRLWIVQEVVLAPRDPEVRIMRGSYVFSMQRIALAMSVIYECGIENMLGYRYPARFNTLWAERINRKNEPSLLEVVIRNWLTFATDPRDKIYGLEGLTKNSGINIDYDPSNTVKDVYTNFTRTLISQNRNLAILGALSSSSEKRDAALPSWVPDWRVWNPHTDVFIFPDKDVERNFLHFTAAGQDSLTYFPTYVGNTSNQLQVEGYIIDTIVDAGPVHKDVNDTHTILEFFRKSEYYASVHDQYTVAKPRVINGYPKISIAGSKTYPHTGEPRLLAFYSTVTMDDLVNNHAPRRFDSMNRSRRLRKRYLDFHELAQITRNSSPGLFSRFGEYNSVYSRRLMEHSVTEAISVSINRCVIGTKEKGYMGVFCERVRRGDSIVLLKGARLPFAIRKHGEVGTSGEQFWEIVGDGYIHGVMGGEAWNERICEKFTFV